MEDSRAARLIHLERCEPAHNRLRFYNIAVTPNLFGGWTLIREWGRIGRPGTVREMWFESESAAFEAGIRIRQRKERRGYQALATTKNTNNNQTNDQSSVLRR